MRRLFAFALLATAFTANAQSWRALSSSPPFGRFLVATDPVDARVVYVENANRDGVLRSLDRGATWQTLPVSGNPRAIAISMNVVAIAFTSGQLARSTDNATWPVSSIPALISGSVNDIVADPANPNIVYVAIGCVSGCSGGVIKSVDGGTTWSATALTRHHISRLVVDPFDGSIGYAGNTDTIAIYRTTDGGAHWSSILPSSAAVPEMSIDPSVPTTIYSLGTSSLLRSLDRGDHWQTVSAIPSSFGVPFYTAVNPTNTSQIVVVTSSTVIRSSDGGTTWSRIDTGLNATVQHPVFARDGILYAPSPTLGVMAFGPLPVVKPRRRGAAH